MKNALIIAALAVLTATGTVSMPIAAAVGKPDLKVSSITAPGGICNQNKVRVTLVNSQRVAVKQDIPVVLFVSQPPNQPSSHKGMLKNGIRPESKSGTAVWFDNIPLQANGGQITLKALVNADYEITESVTGNNAKVVQVKCGTRSSSSSLASWKVILNDYLNRPVRGAFVSLAGQKRKTNKSGAVVFKSINPGLQQLRIAKKGCRVLQTSVRVKAKSKSHTIKLDKRCV